MAITKPVAALLILLALGGCADKTGTSQPVGKDDSADVLRDRAVKIPPGFSFGEMNESVEFVGASTYIARYDGVAAPTLESGIASSNPDFPPFQTVACTDPRLATWERGLLGFNCTPDMQVRLSSRGQGKNFSFPAPDSETFFITSDGTRAHLFLLAQGH